MQVFEKLTNRGKAQRYRRALKEALQAYSVEVRLWRFISLDSRPVYRVDTDDGSFAAKFHDPTEHELSQMEGEMQFLDRVSRNAELHIEKPLANRQNRFLTEIRSEWLPRPAHVALCTWLPGRQLKDVVCVQSYRHLGRCSALLHKASLSFRPRQPFDILVNDRVFYWDNETILSRQHRALLPKRRQRVFAEGARLAGQAIRKLWRSGKPIVIHNDLHPCNIKVEHGSLSLFDFEDITWGFPQQDIGTAMYHVRCRDDFPELLRAFRNGYEQVLNWPLDSGRQLDHLVIARLLMFANYVVNYEIRPIKHLPRLETELRTILNGSAA